MKRERKKDSRKGRDCAGAYLVLDVLQRVGVIDGVANEDDVRFSIGEWSQPLCNSPELASFS